MSKSPRGVGFPVYSSFALVLGILLYTYKTSMESARTLDFDLRSVDAAYMLVQKMQELTGALRNAEAANNTYVLLGKDRLLEGYRHNVSELRTQIQALSGTSRLG
jgi:CHASE3 domain sensor protein